MIAREKGLQPLADYLCDQEPTRTPLETFAASFVNAEKVDNVEDALEGARHIVAETISDNADIRKLLRRAMFHSPSSLRLAFAVRKHSMPRTRP